MLRLVPRLASCKRPALPIFKAASLRRFSSVADVATAVGTAVPVTAAASGSSAAALAAAYETAPPQNPLWNFDKTHVKLRHGHKFRGLTVMQKLESEMKDHYAAKVKFDDFRAGDHIAVKMYAQTLDKPKFQIITGVCIARQGGKGLYSSFMIRTVVLEEQVEYHFFIYSPWIQAIKKLKDGGLKQRKAFALRKMTNSFFVTSRWNGDVSSINYDPVGIKGASTRPKAPKKLAKKAAKGAPTTSAAPASPAPAAAAGAPKA